MDLPTLANLCLQGLGTRTTVTAAQLAANSSNEAIQFNIAVSQTRDELLRMAQWNCAKGTAVLNYITSSPGTPENQAVYGSLTNWIPGLPIPPWTYEYQYPVDCLRALSIVPQWNTGVQGIPIYPTATPTGYSPSVGGPPIKFEIAQDQFYEVTGASVVSGGTGYAVGDTITLPGGSTFSNDFNSDFLISGYSPIGAPAQLLVTGVSGGVITTVSIVAAVIGEDSNLGGSYFAILPNPQSQQSTSGSGAGATFNLTWSTLNQQRIILTNQQSAVLQYVRQVTDPNIMDPLFLRAWRNILSAELCMALTGDKQMANSRIQIANMAIAEARATDANEALTVNDVTPDFLRTRGVIYSDYWNMGTGVDWGSNGWPGY